MRLEPEAPEQVLEQSLRGFCVPTSTRILGGLSHNSLCQRAQSSLVTDSLHLGTSLLSGNPPAGGGRPRVTPSLNQIHPLRCNSLLRGNSLRGALG